jgi:CrcB protein
MSRFLWICLGGAVGTAARYLLGGWLLAAFGSLLPWGTLAVNLIGSFLIAGIMHVSLATKLIPPTLRLALTTGVMGGFTTYSSFNYETIKFVQDGAMYMAVMYLGLMLLACLAAGLAGFWAAQALVGG